MKGIRGILAILAVVGFGPSGALAACLDDRGVSGYHIPLEKELQTAHAVAIGTVLSEREVRESSPGRYDGGTLYRFKIEETLRGARHSTLDLFSENTSGRFPMRVGQKYLVFVTKRGAGVRRFFVSN